MTFEMANSDDPEAIIKASQVGVIKAMRQVISEMKESKECNGRPGLTWDEIDYLLEEFEKKDATIIYQNEPI